MDSLSHGFALMDSKPAVVVAQRSPERPGLPAGSGRVAGAALIPMGGDRRIMQDNMPGKW
jgi:hypothetical protein